MRALELDGLVLVRLANSGFHGVIAQLLENSTQRQRARERARLVVLAGTLQGGPSQKTAGVLYRRMVELSRRSRATHESLPINVATVDGALLGALMIDGWAAPHVTTVHRAWARRRCQSRAA